MRRCEWRSVHAYAGAIGHTRAPNRSHSRGGHGLGMGSRQDLSQGIHLQAVNTAVPVSPDVLVETGLSAGARPDEVCCSCMAEPVSHRLLLCGHTQFCGNCATLLVAGSAVQDTRAPPSCPACRREVATAAPIGPGTEQEIAARPRDQPIAAAAVAPIRPVILAAVAII